MMIDDFLGRLQKVRPARNPSGVGGQGWLACCPAHFDRSPSLAVAVGATGAIVLHCLAGCATRDVLGAMELSFTDLFPAGTRRRRRRRAVSRIYTPAPPCTPSRCVPPVPSPVRGVAPDAPVAEVARVVARISGCVEVYVYTPDYLRIRFANAAGGKNIVPVSRSPGGWVWAEPVFAGPKPLFFPKAAAPGDVIYVTEGENKVRRMTEIGFAACTSGGAASAKRADWSPVAGYSAVVIPDADRPGYGYADDVVAAVKALGCVVAVVDVRVLAWSPGYDVADYIADARVSGIPMADIRGAIQTFPLLPR